MLMCVHPDMLKQFLSPHSLAAMALVCKGWNKIVEDTNYRRFLSTYSHCTWCLIKDQETFKIKPYTWLCGVCYVDHAISTDTHLAKMHPSCRNGILNNRMKRIYYEQIIKRENQNTWPKTTVDFYDSSRTVWNISDEECRYYFWINKNKRVLRDQQMSFGEWSRRRQLKVERKNFLTSFLLNVRLLQGSRGHREPQESIMRSVFIQAV